MSNWENFNREGKRNFSFRNDDDFNSGNKYRAFGGGLPENPNPNQRTPRMFSREGNDIFDNGSLYREDNYGGQRVDLNRSFREDSFAVSPPKGQLNVSFPDNSFNKGDRENRNWPSRSFNNDNDNFGMGSNRDDRPSFQSDNYGQSRNQGNLADPSFASSVSLATNLLAAVIHGKAQGGGMPNQGPSPNPRNFHNNQVPSYFYSNQRKPAAHSYSNTNLNAQARSASAPRRIFAAKKQDTANRSSSISVKSRLGKTPATKNPVKFTKSTKPTGKKVDKPEVNYDGIPNHFLHCTACNKKMPNTKAFKNHVNAPHHKTTMQILSKEHDSCVKFLRNMIESIENRKSKGENRKKNKPDDETSSYNCTLCQCMVKGPAVDHRQHPIHEQLKKYVHINCKYCKKYFKTKIEYDHHTLTPEHLKQLKENDVKEVNDMDWIKSMATIFKGNTDDSGDGNMANSGRQFSDKEETREIHLTCPANIDQYKIPEYNEKKMIGYSFVKPVNGSFCRACKKFLNADAVRIHMQSKEHYERYVAIIKEKKKAKDTAASSGKVEESSVNKDSAGNKILKRPRMSRTIAQVFIKKLKNDEENEKNKDNGDNGKQVEKKEEVGKEDNCDNNEDNKGKDKETKKTASDCESESDKTNDKNDVITSETAEKKRRGRSKNKSEKLI